MGQKINPMGLRIGIIKDWRSRWFAKKDYASFLHEDIKIRKFIKTKMPFAGISVIEIERVADKIRLIIHTARPGIVIGRKGQDIEGLRVELEELTNKEVNIDIKEIKNPNLDAYLIAENIAQQLVKRISYRRAMKRAVSQSMENGAGGIKISCGGRLGGAEMKRTVWYREGRVPLHTLNADIDFGLAEALCTYGKIGVKVWLFHKIIAPEARKFTAKAFQKKHDTVAENDVIPKESKTP
jgi:small subunit ribosomal protein S3